MKKNLYVYSSLWILAFIAFNLISFLLPNIELRVESPAFWTAYVVIILTFLGSFGLYFYLYKKSGLEVTMHDLALSRLTTSCLVANVIIGAICVVFSGIVGAVGAVIVAVVFIVNLVAVLRGVALVSISEESGQADADKTRFMKELILNAENLKNSASAGEIGKLTKAVYEAVRYSDPMSSSATQTDEAEIGAKFNEFSASASSGELESAKKISEELLALISSRNAKCKLYK